MTNNKHCTEDWLRQDVENAVDDSFRIGRDDITTFGETPSDRVNEPQEDCPGTAHDEGAANGSAKGVHVLASDDDNIECSEEEGETGENKVSPLV